MPIDVNRSGDDGDPPIDMEELSRQLGACAHRWVPELFPKGRIVDGELRLADITGRPPRKKGSCVIQLTGEFAGHWRDFDGDDHGGAISTLSHATGLRGSALIKRAIEISGYRPNGVRSPAAAMPRAKAAKPANASEIANILAHCVPAAGTLVETYLRSRKLALPPCADLLFNPNVTDFRSSTGRPAMIAVPRDRAGDRIDGLHRTFLEADGSGKAAAMAKPRLTLGASDDIFEGAAVRLFPLPPDGRIGVAEGIETALAAAEIHGMPVWAALSTSGVRNFGFPNGVTEIVAFADAGKAGIGAAEALIARATAAGIKARMVLPQSGDDFNTDLMQGLAAQPQSQPSRDEGVGTDVVGPAIVAPSAETAMEAARTLSREASPAEINAVLRALALARTDKVTEERVLTEARKRSGMSAPTAREAMKQVRRELGMTALVRVGGAQGNGRTPDWCAKMILYESGEPKPILENVAVALTNAPEWQDVLWFDEFAQNIMVRRPPPWLGASEAFVEHRLTNLDLLDVTGWVQRAGIHAGSDVVSQAIERAASRRVYHPVRDYLDGLAWDHKPRLDTWASYYLGVEDSPYVRAVAARWMISAVARIYHPGVKADCALVLEGAQGMKKSTALRVLGDPWFTDEIEDLGSKDAALQTAGIWIIELGELSSMRRVEINRVKGFLARTDDRFRPPYGKYIVKNLRQCVFAGSVNDEEWHDDPTGARRFWPIKCQAIDVESLDDDRDQLWAEAVERYRAHEPHFLHEPELISAARGEALERKMADPWEAEIGDWLARQLGAEVTVRDILLDCLKVETAKQARSDQMRVVAILMSRGWKMGRSWKKSTYGEKRYLRPETTDATDIDEN